MSSELAKVRKGGDIAQVALVQLPWLSYPNIGSFVSFNTFECVE